MSFTVLRVEVQQWEDEGISLPVGGQSEEGVEADDVVEEEGHQEDCGQVAMRDTVHSVFMFRAESHRIFPTPFIDPFQSITITIRMIVSTAWWWFVQFDGQVDIGVYVCCRKKNVEKQNDKDRYQLHLKVKCNSTLITAT